VPYREGFVKNRYIGKNFYYALSRREEEIGKKKVKYS